MAGKLIKLNLKLFHIRGCIMIREYPIGYGVLPCLIFLIGNIIRTGNYTHTVRQKNTFIM